MTLYLIGHSYQYELSNLIKMFFPLIRLNVAEEENVDDPNRIVTFRREEGENYHLAVTVEYEGAVRRRTATVPRTEEPSECERVFAVLLYGLLEELTGVHPKWGILTGIRPVKLVTEALRAGKSEEEIFSSFAKRYLIDREKIRLLLDTAKTEQAILGESDPRAFSLYLSIPFCPSRCAYCSFVSHSVEQAKRLIPAYIATLCREIEAAGELTRSLGLHLRTVYFGGGTPTVLSAEQLRLLFERVAVCFNLSGCREYTVEAGRADTITLEKLLAIRDCGATRISINPQSFDDGVLEAIGRRHTAQDVVDRYRLARSLGFGNINMDFIAGLKGDTRESFRRTMETALSLAPENITVHTLSVKRSSNLYRDRESLEMIRENPTAWMADYAQRVLGEAGYRPYYLYRQKNTLQNLENVGFCQPGYEGLYNIYIMEELQTIVALGGGAVTKLVDPKTGYIERIFNYKFPYEYIGQFNELLRRKERIRSFYEERS